MQQHSSKYFASRLPSPPDPEEVKIQLFQNMVMLHIKLKRIVKYSNLVAHILPADSPLSPRS